MAICPDCGEDPCGVYPRCESKPPMSAMDVAKELTEGAERARLAGDTVASLALACKASEYLQIAKLLGDAIKGSKTQPEN